MVNEILWGLMGIIIGAFLNHLLSINKLKREKYFEVRLKLFEDLVNSLYQEMSEYHFLIESVLESKDDIDAYSKAEMIKRKFEGMNMLKFELFDNNSTILDFFHQFLNHEKKIREFLMSGKDRSFTGEEKKILISLRKELHTNLFHLIKSIKKEVKP